MGMSLFFYALVGKSVLGFYFSRGLQIITLDSMIFLKCYFVMVRPTMVVILAINLSKSAFYGLHVRGEKLMIKINDRFSIERTQCCWELHEKIYSGKAKKGYSESVTYFSRLKYVIDAIFDRAPQGCKDLKDMYNQMRLIKAEVFRAIMGGNNGMFMRCK